MAPLKLKLPKKPNYIKFADNIDFYQLFKKINQYFNICFLLESLGPESYLSRYSIIGFNPKYIISAKDGIFTIGQQEYQIANPYDALRQIIPQDIISRTYCGGLIGYLGYGCINYFEPSLKIKTHKLFPQFIFGFYTDGIVLDKMTGEISYFYYTDNRLNIIKKISQTKIKNKKLTIKRLCNTLTKKQYTNLAAQAKEEILAGNTFQCQIGFKTEYQISGDDLQIYTRLRKVNPSPHMYYLKFGKLKIIGASPELLFRVIQREMETYPLAGTIKRGKNDITDMRLARKLLNDEKEIAEHNMLVDLHRNDIGKVAEFGTVKVRRLMDIKKFSHVQHIGSMIAGIMANGKNMFSALASNFPAGTLTGAPKIESIKIIDQLEAKPRGPYGGALGHFGFNGDCIFAILIRSLFIYDEYAYTQNSSGIVYDSVAVNEYKEIKRKAEAMEKVLT